METPAQLIEVYAPDEDGWFPCSITFADGSIRQDKVRDWSEFQDVLTRYHMREAQALFQPVAAWSLLRRA